MDGKNKSKELLYHRYFSFSAQHIDLTKPEKGKKAKEKIGVATLSVPVPKLNSVTKYGEDYYEKAYSKRDPIRSGTSSGMRKNNPHPKKVPELYC